MIDRVALLEPLADLAAQAGDVVWDHFTAGCAVMTKADESPVTAADHAAEAIILAGLQRLAPGIPVVAEEEAAAGRIPVTDGAFFLVDPLDGTREFVARGDDFTVNIGLIEDGVPTLGVVYAPARGLLCWGAADAGAWTAQRPPHGIRGGARSLVVREPPPVPCAVASRSHAAPEIVAWLDAAGISACTSVGSSLKFALVALGEADVYPRIGPTMEWDTAAGDAVLRAAGGMTYDPDGAPFRYGKPAFRNTGFIASGGLRNLPLLRQFLDPPRSA